MEIIMTENRGFRSRKFITTNYIVTLGTVVTGASMYLDKAMPAGFYILLAAGIAAYNWSNLRESQNGSASR